MNNTTQSPDDNASESAPSALCTDCPQEIYLEFSVVNYAGEQVASLQEFELDGMPVRQNTIIGPVKSGKHTLKALDGNELRQEILGRRHAPKRPKTTPAATQAYQQNKNYYYSTKDSLWNGLYIFTYPYGRPFRNGYLIKYIIEIEYGIDYCILMVFLDNHSGNIHGSGHAGALIINGQTQDGMFSDFGPYFPLGGVRTLELKSLLKSKNGEPNRENMGEAFHKINIEHGSNIVSKHACLGKHILFGPEHEGAITKEHSQTIKNARNIDINIIKTLAQNPFNTETIRTLKDELALGIPYTTPSARQHIGNEFLKNLIQKSGFEINGLIAWAGYILSGGAYTIMEQYVKEREKEFKAMQDNGDNAYVIYKFNCMTYAQSVLYTGLGRKLPSRDSIKIDYPNGEIQKYMDEAQLCGIFNDRRHEGEPDVVDSLTRAKEPGINHHDDIEWFLGAGGLHAHP